MAKKGERGPTAGRKAAVYMATLPSGSLATMRSHNVRADEAQAIVYQHPEGGWRIAGIVHADAGDAEIKGNVVVPARRIK